MLPLMALPGRIVECPHLNTDQKQRNDVPHTATVLAVPDLLCKYLSMQIQPQHVQVTLPSQQPWAAPAVSKALTITRTQPPLENLLEGRDENLDDVHLCTVTPRGAHSRVSVNNGARFRCKQDDVFSSIRLVV